MGSIEDFNLLKEEINKLENTSNPNIPVTVALQEAEDLYDVAKQDKDLLVARGLPEELITQLNQRAGALREAETHWYKSQKDKTNIESEWKEKSPLAYELRSDLIDEFEYAFHGNDRLLARVNDVKKGYGAPDMIQDLNNLSGLGKDHTDLLEAKNMDLTLLDVAAQTSDAMADLLAKVNGLAIQGGELIEMRNKAFWYLEQAMREVRRAGKFVFRKDPKHIQYYYQHYRNN